MWHQKSAVANCFYLIKRLFGTRFQIIPLNDSFWPWVFPCKHFIRRLSLDRSSKTAFTCLIAPRYAFPGTYKEVPFASSTLSYLRLVTIIHNTHQINRNQSQTPHHAPTHHLQPIIRSISNHHDSLIQNIRAPTFRIRSHRHHHRIIQKHKQLGRHPIQIHQKHPGPSPPIQSKCRQILELTIHQTSPSTPF